MLFLPSPLLSSAILDPTIFQVDKRVALERLAIRFTPSGLDWVDQNGLVFNERSLDCRSGFKTVRGV